MDCIKVPYDSMVTSGSGALKYTQVGNVVMVNCYGVTNQTDFSILPKPIDYLKIIAYSGSTSVGYVEYDTNLSNTWGNNIAAGYPAYMEAVYICE